METGEEMVVTVIGGYLGAGKTTLVNHLLRHAGGTRLAVLVNEFGELPIDGDLIEAVDCEVIDVVGGCICCSYGNDLVTGLLELATIEPRPDHVLIEASGVALPGAVAGMVQILDGFALNGVVVIADADTLREHAADPYLADTILRQFTDADIVILNKIDLVSDDTRNAASDWLTDRYPDARIMETSGGVAPPGVLLGIRLDSERSLTGGSSQHASSFSSIALELEGAMDVERFAKALTSSRLGLIRAKGFARSVDDTIMAIQTVGRRWDLRKVKKNPPSRIVCIGAKPHPDPEALRQIVSQHILHPRSFPSTGSQLAPRPDRHERPLRQSR